jgi:hypothetical protein
MKSATAQLDKQRAIEVITKPQTLSRNAVEESCHVPQIVVSLRPSLFIKAQVFRLHFCLFRFSFISLRRSFKRWSNSQTKDDGSFGRKMVLKAGVDIEASLGGWAT